VEVDFMVQLDGVRCSIEAKASKTVTPHDLRGLKCFAAYAKPQRSAVWYLGESERQVDGIDIIPWQQGLREMGL
jgi:predicted AAA+ superfamily ATPase